METVNSNQPHRSCEWEKIKGVWNTLMKSPIFHRKKKSTDESSSSNHPPLKLNFPSNKRTAYSPPVSPLLLERFLHQHLSRVNNNQKLHRSTSVSPIRKQVDFDQEESPIHLKEIKFDVQMDKHKLSPEPPPRLNKVISPLLARRLAYNNLPTEEIPPDSLFINESPHFNRRYFGIPPHPPRRRSQESKSSSVPCSPLLHRVYPSTIPLSKITNDNKFTIL